MREPLQIHVAPGCTGMQPKPPLAQWQRHAQRFHSFGVAQLALQIPIRLCLHLRQRLGRRNRTALTEPRQCGLDEREPDGH